LRAALFDAFEEPIRIENVADPEPTDTGVVIAVKATGLCRSDWHGWMGHDPDIRLPHVPGHELAGVVEAVGRSVRHWAPGDRVTVPFVGGCGSCPQCESGNQQVCDAQFQPGFTHWGSFAKYVAIDYADVNLVRLPDDMGFTTAASLGCRFVTSFRAVVDQGRVAAGEWVAVHGCGGVGLSAVMIASALGARVVAVDINPSNLALARAVGAEIALDANNVDDAADAIRERTSGGVQVSLDALGSPLTCGNSIASLSKRGRHVQVGLLPGDQRYPPIPMDRVIADELEIVGSHGMQAHRYPTMLDMIRDGRLQPERLVVERISLDDVPRALPAMDRFSSTGVTVIDRL